MAAARDSSSSGRRSKTRTAATQHRDAGGDGRDALLSYLPLVVLAALTAVFFWRLITPLASGRAWLWEDFLYQNFPYRFFAATSLRRGIFPFWNPYVFGGLPFFADIQTAVLYPLNLVQALFAGPDRLNPYLVQFTEVLHYFLAGWFTFRYLRLQKLAAESALLGATAFAFSGFLVTHAIHLNFLSVFVWLPLILELFQRALNTEKLRYAAGCALVLALSTLGGYPQYTLYICYTLGLYWLIHELELLLGGGWRARSAAMRLAVLGGVVTFGVGLNAFNWLPAAELARYTPRSSMAYGDSVEHSLAPAFLLKLLCPKFFGVQYPGENTYWAGGYSSFWETCLFMGVLPLALAAWALGLVRRERNVRFAALLGAVSLVLALGKYGLLYRLFFSFAPGFDRFRIPGRLAALVSFALAILAAHGWERLLRARSSGKIVLAPTRVAAALFSVLLGLVLLLKAGALDSLGGGALAQPEVKSVALGAALVGLAWTTASTVLLALAGLIPARRLGLIGYVAVLFVFSELMSFGQPFLLGNMSPDQLYADSPLLRKIQAELKNDIFRVNARSLDNPGIMVLRRNQGSIDRVFLIEGYNPLQLKRRLGNVQTDRSFDLMNVKYKIQVDYQARTAGLALNPTCLPRAFILHRWTVLEGDTACLARLNSPDFDCHTEAVLEEDPGIDSQTAAEHIESEVHITSYGQNEIVLETTGEGPGILVLSEWDYPAWKAWVDGQPRKVLRVDYALRGLALEKGRHTIRFAYHSDSFRTGLAISLSLAALLALFSVVAARRRLNW